MHRHTDLFFFVSLVLLVKRSESEYPLLKWS